MNKWKTQVPAGMQDFLPEECFNKRQLEEKIRRIFFLKGYEEIETPLFEYFDVFAEGKSSIEQERMFKFFEPGSRILVLRPDITMPIARIAATKLRDRKLPLRLAYISNVYRYEELESVKQREIAQAGIELLGVKGPEADAEIIATAIEIFLEVGLKEFQIDIGQVEFFKGLLEEIGLNEAQVEELRHLIDSKNVLALEVFLSKIPVSNRLKDVLMTLPKLYGNGEMLKEAALLSDNPRCREAIENINQVYRILKDYGLERYISFDLGMVQSINYYTGIIFRGMVKGLGYPICGGGRYDHLVAEYGYDIPATGFALGIKRLLVMLERQKGLEGIPPVDVLVVYDDEGRKTGYNIMQRLRGQGKRVELFLPAGPEAKPVSYARSKGIKKVIKITGSRITEIDT